MYVDGVVQWVVLDESFPRTQKQKPVDNTEPLSSPFRYHFFICLLVLIVFETGSASLQT